MALLKNFNPPDQPNHTIFRLGLIILIITGILIVSLIVVWIWLGGY